MQLDIVAQTPDFAISTHLLTNVQHVIFYSNYNICIHSLFYLEVAESVFIKLTAPDICRQGDLVFKMSVL